MSVSLQGNPHCNYPVHSWQPCISLSGSIRGAMELLLHHPDGNVLSALGAALDGYDTDLCRHTDEWHTGNDGVSNGQNTTRKTASRTAVCYNLQEEGASLQQWVPAELPPNVVSRRHQSCCQEPLALFSCKSASPHVLPLCFRCSAH